MSGLKCYFDFDLPNMSCKWQILPIVVLPRKPLQDVLRMTMVLRGKYHDRVNPPMNSTMLTMTWKVGSYCDNGILSNKDVYQVLFLINDKRAILAGGLQVNGISEFSSNADKWNPVKLPPAKNMSKMAYDCALEQNASKALTELDCGSMSEAANAYFHESPSVSISSALWYALTDIESYGFDFTATQSLKYENSDQDMKNYANLMRADASRIGCASKTCSGEPVYFCVTNQKPISSGDEIYEIRTDDSGAEAGTDNSAVNTECDLPWTSSTTSTAVIPNTSTSESQYTTASSQYTTASSQYTTASSQYTTASSQYTTASPDYTTASTKKAKSKIQCVTKTTKTPCAKYPPHAKSGREARAANFREALSEKSKKHMTQKVRKTEATGRFQNAFEENPLR